MLAVALRAVAAGTLAVVSACLAVRTTSDLAVLRAFSDVGIRSSESGFYAYYQNGDVVRPEIFDRRPVVIVPVDGLDLRELKLWERAASQVGGRIRIVGFAGPSGRPDADGSTLLVVSRLSYDIAVQVALLSHRRAVPVFDPVRNWALIGTVPVPGSIEELERAISAIQANR
jgi:hypothetical protein